MTNATANDFTFGIEIETTVSNETVRKQGMDIGSYHRGNQVPFLPTGWTAERDASIRVPDGRQCCEIVSPVLKGEAGILQVIEVVQKLDELGFSVNESCGIHVHIGWRENWDACTLAKLISIVSYLEKGIFATTGTKRREASSYCNGIRKHGNEPKAKAEMDRSRYNVLNTRNLTNNDVSRRTVEFRAFSGSLSATKIIGWIQLCLGIVERAADCKRTPAWEPKPATGGWKRDGEGESETERLMGYLAWGGGYAKLHKGKQYGWISNAIPMDEIKTEFRRLARKYDAQQ